MTNRSAPFEERLVIYALLEDTRRRICCYARDPCDCKYGRNTREKPGSEQTGCPELRDLISDLTGWTPFNRGQSVTNDLDALSAAHELVGRRDFPSSEDNQ